MFLFFFFRIAAVGGSGRSLTQSAAQAADLLGVKGCPLALSNYDTQCHN